jgi:hypothetical protein
MAPKVRRKAKETTVVAPDNGAAHLLRPGQPLVALPPITSATSATIPASGFVVRETKVVRSRRRTLPRSQGAYTEDRLALLTEADLTSALADAKSRGEIDQLCWFVEMKVPGHLLERRTPLITAALHPGGTLPILPVGDPLLSRPLVEILLVCFEEYNRGSGIEFGLNVADRSTFEGHGAYVWGEEIDAICEVCGAVFRHTAFVTICDDCCRRQIPLIQADPYLAQWRYAVRLTAVCLRAGGLRTFPPPDLILR